MTIKLQPCKSCGTDDWLVPKRKAGEHWLHCEGCEADGPKKDTPEAAAKAWNRANPDQVTNR